MSTIVGVYSFLDVHGAITGPFGTVPLGAGSAAAEEGISIEYTEDKDRMLIGADGSAMHSLNASKAGKCLVRLLKTSPTNALLEALYNAQTVSSLFHGKNTISVANPVTGDKYVCAGAAFTKFPRNDYAKEAGMLEWDFNVSEIDVFLGSGVFLVV
ncbi:MAG TPA: phage protein [Candidatus Binatia bacterium]|nr:phage protein [Candidatus Binatia bacterium]